MAAAGVPEAPSKLSEGPLNDVLEEQLPPKGVKDESSKQAAEDAGALTITFHLSCNKFRGVGHDGVQKFLVKECRIPIEKLVKQKPWKFAFATLSHENASQFCNAASALQYRGVAVAVSEYTERSKRKAPEASQNEPLTKRRKDDSVPILKELRDKAKAHGKNWQGTILQKSAPLIDMPYETQLAMKDTFVKTAVRSFTKLAQKQSAALGSKAPSWCGVDWSVANKAPNGCAIPVDPPIGAPEGSLDGWRNKCEFSVGFDAANAVEVGFVLQINQDGAQVVASVQDVPLVPAAMRRLCATIRDSASTEALRYPVFDRREAFRKGVWRTIMARLSPAGEMLVMVQTTTLEGDAKEEFKRLLIGRLAGGDLGVVSIYLQFNDEVTDAARPNAHVELIHGQPRLEMSLCDFRLQIGPLSFFNPNTVTCKFLMETAIEFLKPQKSEVLLDVFCGVGTIGLCAAQHCRKVVGIEIVPEAVEMAKSNAALNNIHNTEWHVGKAEDLLPRILGDMDESVPVCAVVDPARAGLHPRVLSALRSRTQVSRIVYISCNAESLAEDVAKFGVSGDEEEDDFVPVRAVAVDSFPQTLHVEVIALIERASRVPDPRKASAKDPCPKDPSPPSEGKASMS